MDILSPDMFLLENEDFIILITNKVNDTHGKTCDSTLAS